MTTYSNIRYAAAGVTEYATANDLPNSAAAGSQAFVADNNRLYIWNGTGWYNIALINTNPSISGVSSSYTLAQDGTATTVTIVASDPEGLPITYSLASDTSGSTATVVQGTGASTNVFTITPSTSDANAGTFTLTFRASDGANIATVPAEFSLAFAVVNSPYTSALITSVGADNAVNNSFIDSSTNAHTITAFGDIHQTTFSPYRHGGYSLHFPGAVMMDLGFSTLNSGDWTFECWAKVSAGGVLLGKYGGGNKLEAFGVEPSTGYMYTHTGAGVEAPTCTNDLRDGNWHYLVWERYNGTYYYWADGTLEASFANTETPSATANWQLGGGQSHGGFTGNMKEARFSLSTAVYTGSAPTTPTEPQTTPRSTDAFFTGVGLEVKDYSSNNRTFTPLATLKLQPIAPYDYTQYSSADNGASLHLDGSGDYIKATTATLGTGDFTLEAWVYRTATGATWQTIIAQRTGTSANAAQYNIGVHSTGYVYFYAGAQYASTPAGVIGLNRWHHIACTRNGTTVKQFVDGVEKVSGTCSNNLTYTELTIGANNTGVEPFTGIISNPRVVVGTSVYNSDFTPPTSPLTAVTNTEILVKGTNAGVIDKSQSVQGVTLYGAAQSSTTQTKYLTSSMYFNPSATSATNYIVAKDCSADFGTGDFTVECWIWPESVSTSYATSNFATILDLNVSVNSGTAWFALHQNNAGLQFASNSVAVINATSGLTAQQWNHVAVVRNGTTIAIYVDGVSQNTVTYSSTIGSVRDLYIGRQAGQARWYEGYVSDVRITKGLARYTSAFTPPTAALQG